MSNVRIEKRLLSPTAGNRNVRAFYSLVGGQDSFFCKYDNKDKRTPDPIKQIDSAFQNPQYIIIHEVSMGLGKTNSTYNMDYYEKLINSQLEGKDWYGKLGIGFHYLVSDKEIRQYIEDWESTKSAGILDMNLKSISIERLVNEDIDFDQAIYMQAKIAATLMIRYNIPLENVKFHVDVSGKDCPSRLNAGLYGGREGFYEYILHALMTEDLFKEKFLEYRDLDELRLLQERLEPYKALLKKNISDPQTFYKQLFPNSHFYEQGKQKEEPSKIYLGK